MKVLLVLAALMAAACAVRPTDSEIQMQWEGFKTMHGKVYADKVEEEYRMKIFKENAIKVAKHNELYHKGEVTFKVGVNKYSDLHTHEFAEKLNGFRMEMAKKSGVVHRASNATDAKEVDWRSQGYVTPVKDQGQCGSCWSFSTTGSLEGQLFKKTGKLVSLSEQNLVDCASGWSTYGCDGGYMDGAFQYIQSNGGIDSEASYPYEGRKGHCRYSAENRVGTGTGFVDVRQTESHLKDAVAEVGPVAVAIDASHWSFQHYAGGVYYEPQCSYYNLDHAVLAVGFGTDFKKGDYWIIKNSWGPSWGEQGYIRMSRNKQNHCGIASMASYPTV